MTHVSILNEDPLISLCWMFRTFTLYLHSCLLFVLWILIPGANTPFLSFKSMYSPLLSGGEAYKEKPADSVTVVSPPWGDLPFFCLSVCKNVSFQSLITKLVVSSEMTTVQLSIFFFLEHNEPLKEIHLVYFRKVFFYYLFKYIFWPSFFLWGGLFYITDINYLCAGPPLWWFKLLPSFCFSPLLFLE